MKECHFRRFLLTLLCVHVLAFASVPLLAQDDDEDWDDEEEWADDDEDDEDWDEDDEDWDDDDEDWDDDDEDWDDDDEDDEDWDDEGSGERVFQPFKVDVGGGAAFLGTLNALLNDGSQSTASSSLGFPNFSLAPEYAISDNFGVGLRIENTTFANSIINVDGKAVEALYSASHAFSTLIQSNYYLTNSLIRPAIGIGVGMYAIQRNPYDSKDTRLLGVFNVGFGVAPRVQLFIGHIGIGCTYHYPFQDNFHRFVAVDLSIALGGGRN